MRFSRLASFVALLGVLLHAGLTVRHNYSMLAEALHQEQAVPFGVMCNVPVEQQADAQTPNQPNPSKSASKCPICLGAAPGVALTSADTPAIHAPALYTPRLVMTASTVTLRTIVALPPSRAPPATA
jgi:hypothetical protein